MCCIMADSLQLLTAPTRARDAWCLRRERNGRLGLVVLSANVDDEPSPKAGCSTSSPSRSPIIGRRRRWLLGALTGNEGCFDTARVDDPLTVVVAVHASVWGWFGPVVRSPIALPP